MSVFDDARRCICPAVIESYFSADGAKWRGDEFYTLSPLRPDKHIKNTFSINKDGLYKDHATGDGGDFIDLVARAHGITTKQAAQKIVDQFGHGMESHVNAGGGRQAESAKQAKQKKPAVVIPDTDEARDALRAKITSKYSAENYGKAVKVYAYRNIDDEIIMYVVRYESTTDGEKRKQLIPYYYDGTHYQCGRPKNLRIPLFGEHLLRDKSKPVLIVEGEKCAKVVIDGWHVISWIGGCANADNIDWSMVADWPQSVVIWPDNDTEGRKAALKINEAIPKAEILEITDRPEKWDIADAEAEGLDLVEFIRKCQRAYKEIPTTPHDAFIAAITDLYGIENFEQYDGCFYVYSERRHFWKKRSRESVESDVQLWVLENVRQFLDESNKAVHTFVANAKSFIKSYSRNYYDENPFKETALQPYIHTNNGCIHIKPNGFVFHDRTTKPESFFRQLYPLNVLDVNYDAAMYENAADVMKNAPLFYKYCIDVMPDSAREKHEERQKTIDMFSQILAYSINPIKKKPAFFAFYGKQQSGKTFFMELLKKMIDKEFFVETPIKNMDNRFASSNLFGSKIYVDDDFKAGVNLPDDFIKSYCGEKTISIEYKNQNTIKGVKISIAMFFLSNHPFTVQGGTEGIERRFVYVPFRQSIKTPDVFFLERMIGECEREDGTTYDERAAILGLALYGMMALNKSGYTFTMPEWVSDERKEWITNSSSITQFLAEEIHDVADGTKWTPTELYGKYKDWCTANDKKPFGRNNFYESVRQDDMMDFTHSRSGNLFTLRRRDVVDDAASLQDIPF